MNNNILRTAIT